MNFLAHARLSFQDPDILLGNMISDFVKGKLKYDYPEAVQRGIHLHRLIDSFTDTHPVVQEAKELFRPAYRLYSGAIIDVVFDHFLATDDSEYSESSLRQFSQQVYETLESQKKLFPPTFSRMFPYMQTQNWLYGYRMESGIENSLRGLVHRAKYLEDSGTAIRIFNNEYARIRAYYEDFWPELKNYALRQLEETQP